MSDIKIIFITGRKGHGKDTVADYLVKYYDFHKLAFAEPVKEICKIAFNFSDQQLEDRILKEQIDLRWGFSPRDAFRKIGTDFFRRNIRDDIWVKLLADKLLNEVMRGIKKFVISDLRFPEELTYIQTFNITEFKIWKIIRREHVDNDTHISENLLDEIKEDILINNNSSKLDLYLYIDNLMK